MNRPPVLTTPPLLNLLQWIAQPLNFLDRWTARYEDAFAVSFGNLAPLTFLSHPQAIEQMFTAEAGQFESGRVNRVLRRTLGDNSLLLLDGSRHKRHRQLLMPPFHGDRMRAYGDLIIAVTEQVTQDWPIDQPVKIRSMMQSISLRVILQAVFGLNTGSRYQELKQALQEMIETTSSRFSFGANFFPWLARDFGSWSPGGRFIRMMQRIDRLLYAEINDRRQQFDPNRSDILTLLLSARDEAGEPMSDAELRDELMTLLIAGHETTATALTWAFYWVHSLPQVQETLRQELASSTLDLQTIPKLPYLNAVCAETLRIYPVAFVAQIRVAQTPVKIMNYEFAEDDLLVPCVYLVHHRADLYPEPKRFRPERFLERQFSPYEYLPFGGSNRRCIGAAFALFEMKLVLATVLQRYQLERVDSGVVLPMRRGVTIAPNRPIEMVVRKRLIPNPAPTSAAAQA